MVLAVTAVLMVMLFVPLSRALDMTQRGNATVKAQGEVQKAMRLVTRELGNAVRIYEPRALNLWGYDTWDASGRRPRPAAGAAPKAYQVWDGMVAFRLPKHRYFCESGHYVTQDDMDTAFGMGTPYDWVAMATCPRDGSPVEMRLRTPLQPDERITAYFIGLKNPDLRSPGGPVYDNLLLFRQRALPNGSYPPDWPSAGLNTYTLYRVEFVPQVQPGNTDNAGNGLDDRWETFFTDPNFFYDTTPVTFVDGQGVSRTQTRSQWWKENSRQVMDTETADVVKWVEKVGASPTEFVPQPVCRFGPHAVAEETAQPNRSVGQYALSGSALPGDVPPLEYQVDYGHFLGLTNDGTGLIYDALGLSNTPSGGAVLGPRIQVYGRQNPADPNSPKVPVFDSQSAIRDRLLAYDAETGRILTAIQRKDYAARNANRRLDEDYFLTSLQPETNGTALYTVDLKNDLQNISSQPLLDGNLMPSGFGTALGWVTSSPARSASVVPGSDVVQMWDGAQMLQFRRVGWTGMPEPSSDRPVAPPELGADEYTIDYTTGVIYFSDIEGDELFQRNPQVRVAYAFQTNLRDDVVRVSYATREVAQVSLGIVEYTRRRQELLPFEVSEQVVIRNMKR